ncbi:uncharacterized protein LOC123314122 [Coccinella septempunctata]|uniref:uncharacterized protein LOC123314122 n=1 Tax=Coccinella septempunctata TaxID=41139 RepID=UPI001D09672F|nr:uncharacterized protein LOC123314122 [Coccinella septempunctata]
MIQQARLLAVSFLFYFPAKCTVVTSPSVEHTFRQCILSTPAGAGSMGQCLGMGVLSKLQNWDNEPEFDLVDGVTLTRDPKEFREAHSFADTDPSSFRSIIDSIGQVFSRRQMRWDMSSIYPGLIMHITPSPGTAGFLEFAIDPHKEAATRNRLKESSTAKLLLTHSFLVPLLLGFKFKVITLIPIIFGVLALIAKKALVLSKISLIISTALALGTLLLGNNNGNYQGQGQVGPQVFNHQYSPPPYHINRFPDHHYGEDSIYRSNNLESGLENNEATQSDQIKLPENLQEIFSTGIGKSDRESRRNFAWNEEEKLKKRT